MGSTHSELHSESLSQKSKYKPTVAAVAATGVHSGAVLKCGAAALVLCSSGLCFARQVKEGLFAISGERVFGATKMF